MPLFIVGQSTFHTHLTHKNSRRGQRILGTRGGGIAITKQGDPLFHFVGKYTGTLLGNRNIERNLKENKGMTMLDSVTPTLYAHGVTYLDNCDMRWGQHYKVERMEDD